MDEWMKKLDDVLRDLDRAGTEQFEEEKADACATLEDVLMLLEETDPEDEDFGEVLEDAEAELEDIAESVRKIPGLFYAAERIRDVLRDMEECFPEE